MARGAGGRWRGSVAWATIAVGTLAGAASAEQQVLKGAWVGGFELDGEWTFARATLAGDAPREGSLELPFLGTPAAVLRATALGTPLLQLEAETPLGALRFEGRLEDGVVSGRVHRGDSSGPWEMARLVELPKSQTAACVGAYALAPDRYLYVQPWEELGPGALVAFDENGTLRVLYPAAEDRFFSGPGIAFPVPVARRVSCVRDSAGAVTSLVLRDREGEQRAPRAALYSETPVRFRSGGLELGGTLFEPTAPGPHPAVVISHGSGAQDRYGSLPFLLPLVRRGFTLLAYDKRGVGTSEGDWRDVGFEELAADARAAVAFLRQRKGIDPRRIGVFGASQGGWVAPLAASGSTDVAFVVVVSAPAVSPAENEQNHTREQMRGWGFGEDEIKAALRMMGVRDEWVRSGTGWESLQAVRDEPWAPFLGPIASKDDPFWRVWRRMVDHAPVPVIERLRCPTLVLLGGRDCNVSATVNAPKWDAALAKGAPGSRVVVLPKANHVLFEAESGLEREIPRLSGFVPEYAPTLLEWLRAQVGPLS